MRFVTVQQPAGVRPRFAENKKQRLAKTRRDTIEFPHAKVAPEPSLPDLTLKSPLSGFAKLCGQLQSLKKYGRLNVEAAFQELPALTKEVIEARLARVTKEQLTQWDQQNLFGLVEECADFLQAHLTTAAIHNDVMTQGQVDLSGKMLLSLKSQKLSFQEICQYFQNRLSPETTQRFETLVPQLPSEKAKHYLAVLYLQYALSSLPPDSTHDILQKGQVQVEREKEELLEHLSSCLIKSLISLQTVLSELLPVFPTSFFSVIPVWVINQKIQSNGLTSLSELDLVSYGYEKLATRMAMNYQDFIAGSRRTSADRKQLLRPFELLQAADVIHQHTR